MSFWVIASFLFFIHIPVIYIRLQTKPVVGYRIDQYTCDNNVTSFPSIHKNILNTMNRWQAFLM
jgi:hypothetical protein